VKGPFRVGHTTSGKDSRGLASLRSLVPSFRSPPVWDGGGDRAGNRAGKGRTPQMLRVVHVIGRMPGHGTQRQLAGMLGSAHGRLWEATLAVLRAGDHLTKEVADAGVPVVEFAGAEGDPRRFVRLRHLFATADVVHSSLWGANVYGRLAAATRDRRPAIVISERSVEEFRSPARRWADRALRRLTEEYIANSIDVAEFVARAHGVSEDRITVIRNGLDRSVFFPESAPRTREGPARLGAVGRLIPEKGLDVLIAAMPKIIATQPVELTVVGDGPQRTELEQEAHGLPVRFVGYKGAPSDVAAFLRSLDVFIMPSRWEGLPNALLEALSCGVPVVATEVPGMADAAGGAAILVPPDQPAALAEAVGRALSSRDRPTVYANSFDDVATAHLAVFERAHARRTLPTQWPEA
jgi:glycosyltransferase involved in cell wall biosynthesis